MAVPIKDTINEVKSVNSPLNFFIYISLVVAMAMVGIAGWSKLNEKLNTTLVIMMFSLFMLLVILSYALVLYNPSRYLYTKDEWMEKEGLTDSESKYKDTSHKANVMVGTNKLSE